MGSRNSAAWWAESEIETMNCQECQDFLDNLLVAEPAAAERAALAEHLENCPDCAGQYARARQALAAISLTAEFPLSHNFKERIMDAISAARVFPVVPAAIPVRRIRQWKITAAALAAAVALLLAAAPLLHPRPGQSGHKGFSAFGLLAEACAAEETLFTGNQLVHLVNEIIVAPVADAALAQMRWLPLMSLEATGKPRFNQLALPAEVGKGYTVEDQSWYDPATGRFVRVLTSGGRPIFANSYDSTNVYILETPAAGPARVVKHPIAKDFRAPKSAAEFLGIAAGLRSGLDAKDESLARDAGKTTLSDGAEARVVKLAFPSTGEKEAMDAYWLVTIRASNNTLEREEWFVQGKSMLVIRRGKTEPGQGPSMGWDLAGIAKQAAGTATTPRPTVMFGMVIPDISVAEMVKKADFKTYVFSKAPSWAGDRQITDILDVASPPHRMFLTAYRAKDGRHVVFLQSYSYNQMLGPMVKMGKVVYTSPSGVKVWSGPRDEWLAKILLQSSRASIKDPPGKDLTGYLLETPAGTFSALAVNGKISKEELHSLIDSLAPAK
jgi:hypothetical protein